MRARIGEEDEEEEEEEAAREIGYLVALSIRHCVRGRDRPCILVGRSV